MELTQDEKDRIVAEEKVRMEAKREMMKDMKGKCGHGHHGCGQGFGGGMGYGCGCQRGGVIKGVLLGILLSLVFCFFFHGHHNGGWDHGDRGGYGGGCYHHMGGWGHQMPQDNQDPNPQK